MVPWSSIFGQTAPKGAVPPKPGKVLDFKLSCFMNFILCSPFVSSFVSSAIILLQCYDPYEKSNFHVVNCTMGPQQLIKKFSSPFSCHAIFMTLSICPRCEPWDQIAKQYLSLSLSLLFLSLFFSPSCPPYQPYELYSQHKANTQTCRLVDPLHLRLRSCISPYLET